MCVSALIICPASSNVKQGTSKVLSVSKSSTVKSTPRPNSTLGVAGVNSCPMDKIFPVFSVFNLTHLLDELIVNRSFVFVASNMSVVSDTGAIAVALLAEVIFLKPYGNVIV